MTYDEAEQIVHAANALPIHTAWLEVGKDGRPACPFCGSGTGAKGTSAFATYDDGHFYCHACEEKGYNENIAVHLLKLTDTKGANFFTLAEFLARELNITAYDAGKFTSSSTMKGASTKMSQSEKEPKDYTNFYNFAQSQLENFLKGQGGSWRGLTAKTLKDARAGYQEFGKDKRGTVILPYDNEFYFRRSVDDTNAAPIKINSKGDMLRLYNPFNVLGGGQTLFAVEGEIDALTLYQCGYKAVATGGAGNWKRTLIPALGKLKGDCKPQFVVMFDNNDKGQGQQQAAELVKELLGRGYKAVNVILDEENLRDANQWLQEDSAGLSVQLKELYAQAEQRLANLEEEMASAAQELKAKKFGIPFRFFFQKCFMAAMKKNQRFIDFKTGLSSLDAVQEWQAGIYTIGAPPSLGKTTFIWQLMEGAARQLNAVNEYVNHCIFVSFEMATHDLFSKSVARTVFEDYLDGGGKFGKKKHLTALQVRQGKFFESDFADEAWYTIENFGKYASYNEGREQDIDLRVLDYSERRINVEELISTLQEIADEVPTTEPLIFALDYLQILANDRYADNAKLAIDDTISRLREFVLKNNCIMFLVSTMNRAAYRTESSFESFKESGSIEYGASVLWALSLFGTDEEGKPSTKQEDLDKTKIKQPRPMVLKCLKNRFGNDYKLFFNYFSAVEKFLPCYEEDLL